jgi:nondiscriminating aspartyl-tRNA synthetase
MRSNMYRSHYANQLDESLVGQKVRISGWIEDIRDIGRLVFLVIRDVTGSVQVVVTGEKLETAKKASRQSAIIISGFVMRSKAKDFPVEIKAYEVSIINSAVQPLPIDPTGRVESSIDKRLDSRALDLRNPKVAALFHVRSAALNIIRDTLLKNNYIEINTPKIIGTASEGGANLFNVDYFKRTAYLAQSPQLYKEQLVLALDKVFEIGSYFRAEKSHTVRHLSEFTSVDVEAAFVDYEDIMVLAERVVTDVIVQLSEKCKIETNLLDCQAFIPIGKIERLTYEECLDELRKEGEKIEFGDDLSDPLLRKLGEFHRGFYFIIDWPVKLKPFYLESKESNSRLSKSFDLQYGYLELASGGARQYDYGKLCSSLTEHDLNPTNFSEHLKAFEWGMPPHSGWGLGFDRLMMVMTNSHNVREVVIYPRDTERLTP